MKNNYLLLAIFIVASCLSSHAQNTGSLDFTTTFNGETRAISIYIPENYDSTKPHVLLVGLHAAGQNARSYRDLMVSSAYWPMIFPNTIMLFPDGGNDQSRDFYTPAGDENFIGACILAMTSRYSIDTSNIILQGFSLGGRSALRYGLTYPETFKGLLLHTPAIQGPLDVTGVPAINYGYKFENASRVPVFVTVGENDLPYIGPIRLAVKTLRLNSCNAKLITIPGMGHAISQNNITSQARPHFEGTFRNALDASLFDISMPLNSCADAPTATCYVQNMGVNDITTMKLTATVGGETTSRTWTGTLAPGRTIDVAVPIATPRQGLQAVSVSVGEMDAQDDDMSNNSMTDSIVLSDGAGAIQNAEGFDEAESSWRLVNSDQFYTWHIDTVVRKTGSASLAAFNSILMYYSFGLQEVMVSPFIDVKSTKNKVLSFDYAYNYHQYTADVFGSNATFADTLDIAVSTDCGVTYQSIFHKAGAALATAANPIMNPRQISECFFIPESNEWKHLVLDLAPYASSDAALVKISYISGGGGSINIDNINIGSDVVSAVAENGIDNGLTIYPNPASTSIILESSDTQYSSLIIYDNTGRRVLERIGQDLVNSSTSIDVSMLSAGMYTLELSSSASVARKRLAIHR